MAQALLAAWPQRQLPGGAPVVARLLALLLAVALAARGQGIVDTMVAVNVLYLTSVGACFIALHAGWRLQAREAQWVMVFGLCGGLWGRLFTDLGWVRLDGNAMSLAVGFGASSVSALLLGRGREGNIRP